MNATCRILMVSIAMTAVLHESKAEVNNPYALAINPFNSNQAHQHSKSVPASEADNLDRLKKNIPYAVDSYEPRKPGETVFVGNRPPATVIESIDSPTGLKANIYKEGDRVILAPSGTTPTPGGFVTDIVHGYLPDSPQLKEFYAVASKYNAIYPGQVEVVTHSMSGEYGSVVGSRLGIPVTNYNPKPVSPSTVRDSADIVTYKDGDDLVVFDALNALGTKNPGKTIVLENNAGHSAKAGMNSQGITNPDYLSFYSECMNKRLGDAGVCAGAALDAEKAFKEAAKLYAPESQKVMEEHKSKSREAAYRQCMSAYQNTELCSASMPALKNQTSIMTAEELRKKRMVYERRVGLENKPAKPAQLGGSTLPSVNKNIHQSNGVQHEKYYCELLGEWCPN